MSRSQTSSRAQADRARARSRRHCTRAAQQRCPATHATRVTSHRRFPLCCAGRLARPPPSSRASSGGTSTPTTPCVARCNGRACCAFTTSTELPRQERCFALFQNVNFEDVYQIPLDVRTLCRIMGHGISNGRKQARRCLGVLRGRWGDERTSRAYHGYRVSEQGGAGSGICHGGA